MCQIARERTREELITENNQLKKIVKTQIAWIKSIADHYKSTRSYIGIIGDSVDEAMNDFDKFFELQQQSVFTKLSILDSKVISKTIEQED